MKNRPLNVIERDFRTEGERLTIVTGRRVTAGEFAALIASRKESAHKAFAIYEASKLGGDFLERVREELRKSMTDVAVYNLWSLGTHIVPIMIRHEFTAGVNTVQAAIRVFFHPGNEIVRDTPEARNVYARLRAGTIRQPEMRRLARINKLASENTTQASKLIKERDRLQRRLKDLDALIAKLQ